uniref:Uncharacterized protein n=1 Tax=Arabidopsis thaliana TaxID=3702 RepID=Q8GXF3_ARATH|nr:unknown protein [Arabidopsis thaliana]
MRERRYSKPKPNLDLCLSGHGASHRWPERASPSSPFLSLISSASPLKLRWCSNLACSSSLVGGMRRVVTHGAKDVRRVSLRLRQWL